MNKFAKLIISIGIAAFLFIASPLVCVDSITAFPIEHRTRAFLLGSDMPKGVYERTLKLCSIKDCNNKHWAKGLCKKHWNKQWYVNNKEKIKEFSKQYYLKDKRKVLKCVKQYQQDNKGHILEYQKKYYQNNKKYKLEYQKQWIKNNSNYIKQWRQTLKGKISSKTTEHNRRAMTKDLKKETVQRVYEDNIEKYGVLTCCLCFKPIESGKDSLEHLTPLIRSGSNKYKNLDVSHLICNLKKGTMTLEEWYANKKRNL